MMNEAAAMPIAPDDEHNRFLVSRVHPPGWENPEPATRYDLVVVGGGSGGLVSAAIGAAVGGRVALVERHLLGGDCLNTGCVPSKAVIRGARAWEEARRAEARYGGPAAAGPGDFARVMERMRRVRAGIAPHDSAERFRGMGVDVFLGEGRFTGADRLEVGGAVLRFRRAVVASGGRPAVPPIPGLEASGYLTSETVFELTELPERLVVVGAGAVGCELAQAFARLGSRVVLLESAPRILPREDPDAADVVDRALRADGVDLRTGVEVREVELGGSGGGEGTGRGGAEAGRAGSGSVRVVRCGDDAIPCDRILVAVGRRPNVEGLGLEAAGVAFDAGGIRTDDRLRTTNRRIWAVGDVTGGPPFTHVADAHARTAVPNALFFGRGRRSRLVIPRCTYTSPELAHVGVEPYQEGPAEPGRGGRGPEGGPAEPGRGGRGPGEEPAGSGRGGRRRPAVDTVTVPFSDVDRAVVDGETEGFLRVHLAAGTDRVLGATVVGEHAGEILAPILVAMRGGVGLDAISGTVFPYPTRAEVLRKAADGRRRRKLTPRTRRWMERVLRLLR
jgi:pyruvate/2-oxoglutarate dehydrogenase complex dihydrolipoamide dehydrogenase (E3) component